MNFDKWICELIGKEYQCPDFDTEDCNTDKYCHIYQGFGTCEEPKLTYGDLHTAKDIINERGEWVIKSDFICETHYYEVIHSNESYMAKSFEYKTTQEAEGALRKALTYVKENIK